MDYIRDFDIRLEKEMYYAGEVLQGSVVLNTIANFKLRAIRVVVRGKGHAEWKVTFSGDRRTLTDDQYFIDDRAIIWGKDKPEGNVPILSRGGHTFPFKFQLPESSLPCSFESKCGTIRYYVKVTVDIPYASPPQGIKYFTVIGPHIDCMDEQYLGLDYACFGGSLVAYLGRFPFMFRQKTLGTLKKPMVGHEKRAVCCLCCKRGPVSLWAQLERSAYVCGESIKLKADIDNQNDEEIKLKLKLVQYVEYFIDRGVLGMTKDIQHPVLEYTGDSVQSGRRWKFDSSGSLIIPVMPPTLISVCRLIQVYYVLKVYILMSKSGEDLHMHFPITIGTVPFRIPNSNQQPKITYSVCCDHVEGGMYTGPEFQLGQVYDGNFDPGAGGVSSGEPVLLYRPVYLCVPSLKLLSIQTPKNRHLLKLDPINLRKESESTEPAKRDRSNSPVAKTVTADASNSTPGKTGISGATGTTAGNDTQTIKGFDKTLTSTM